jgi:hypothetical protein
LQFFPPVSDLPAGSLIPFGLRASQKADAILEKTFSKNIALS